MKKKSKLLIVDDNEGMRKFLLSTFQPDYEVLTVADGKGAIEQVQAELPEVVILDLKLPDMSGVDVLREVKKIDPQICVIIMTAYGTVETSVAAMKLGAYDYIIKPFDPEKIQVLVQRGLETRSLTEEVSRLRSEVRKKYTFSNIIGQSGRMQEVYNLVGKVLNSNVTVLIQGESGTGKELIARAIHYNGLRKDKGLVVVNCAALPESILESELFGHEKGAFTGASSRRIGKFEQADTGTLFLDEIGDMSLSTQAKVLRAIENRSFSRVGGEREIEVDVRILAATNKNLEEEIKRGNFREDLYYRLNVVPIMIPLLREHKEDIPALVEHFIAKLNKGIKHIDSETMKLLFDYDWPGNIRELENTIERAVTLAEGDTILPEYLPLNIQSSAIIKDKGDIKVWMSLKEATDIFRRDYVLKTLKEVDGERKRAMDKLQISQGTFYKIIGGEGTKDLYVKDDLIILNLGKEITENTSAKLTEAIRDYAKEGSEFIIDLSDVPYIGSPGLGIIMSSLKAIRERGGNMRLVGLSPEVKRTFDLISASQIIDIHATQEEAIEVARSHRSRYYSK